MRIIGGTLGGRRFYPPAKGWPTRPTTDVSKEALYNILQGRMTFSEERFLDLFGGTGNHSFEMISRGCRDVTYVDSYRACCAFVRKTADTLGIAEMLNVACMDAFKFCRQVTTPFTFVFAGPPYGMQLLETIPDVIFGQNVITGEGLLVVEHNPAHDFSGHAYFTEVRHYGQTHFSFFSRDQR